MADARQVAAEPSIVVYGAGAVGGYLGAKLSLTHPDRVTLLGRERLVEAVRKHGLTLHDGEATVITHPEATTSPRGIEPADLVILSVRAYDVAATVPNVQELVGEQGLVLTMQNGVGSEEPLVDVLGRDRVLIGTLTTSVGMEEPGVVTRYSRANGMALATMNEAPVPDWVMQIFLETDLSVSAIADYRSLRWSKLLLNMLGAANGAILDIEPVALVSNPSLFRIEQLAFREAVHVMAAQDTSVVSLPGYPVPLARLAMRLPRLLAQALLGPRLARSRGGRSPTMRADLARGRSEIHFFNRAVAQIGRDVGVPTPVNAALADLVEELARHPERREYFRGQPERLVDYLAQRDIHL